MIDEKLDIRSITKTMIEFEKLKYLLFDSNQYVLFEHIPKPILFDKKIFEGQEVESYGYDTSNLNNILEHNCEFWHRQFGDEMKREHTVNFNYALEMVKKKTNPNIIDERLIKILSNFDSDK